MTDISLLTKLCNEFGVSGSEEKIRNLIIEEIKDYVDEIKVDPLGNLICIKKGSNKKILLNAHMDEIGIIATHIDDNGFIRFSSIGGVYAIHSIAKRVQFQNGTKGMIFYEDKLDEMKALRIQNLFIDIGAKTKEEAQEKISIGDTACFIGESLEIGNNFVSKALDDRSGCYALIEVAKKSKESNNEIYYVFTVQEELGTRGAKVICNNLSPDFSITVDITISSDTPESKKVEVKFGGGPAIKIKDSSIISHPQVVSMLKKIATENNIPFQLEILDRGGTDAGSICTSAGGIMSGGIAIPCRYFHSVSESINLNDLQNIINLLCKVVE